MFTGSWCGNMGLTGWLVMATFWVALLGLVVWAVTRLVAPGQVLRRSPDGPDTDRPDAGPREALDRQGSRQ